MTTNLRPLRDALVQTLSSELEKDGFGWNRKAEEFQKPFPGGRMALHIAFIKHETDVDITADVALRFDELENLIYQETPELASIAYSLGAELGNIINGKQRRWTMKSVNDARSVSRSIAEVFRAVGIPYLLRFLAKESALAAFSGDDRNAWLHSPIDDERAKRALGLAFLLEKWEQFRELAERKTAYLASKNDPGLQGFVAFRKRLEDRIPRA